MNLIAAERLLEGVDLLVTVGHIHDACRCLRVLLTRVRVCIPFFFLSSSFDESGRVGKRESRAICCLQISAGVRAMGGRHQPGQDTAGH